MRKNQGQLRIIGGQWKSRKLPILNSEGLRPTTDRVRETLFNWLQFDIAGAVVIDLFAGSGGLGFEAASRGARQVVMVEKDHRVANQLQQNVALLNADNITIVTTDVLQLMQSPLSLPNQWDIVFIDPPFNLGLASQSLEQLSQLPQLSPETLVYLETEATLTLPQLTQWHTLKEKRHGAVCFRLLQKKD
ncbi:16S rRNA (guanine(966)-N(2))-methyltransferase RsmD [Idiomarina sp.]|uniref:16S rRNA (guanine(966)-N(2))-methyltransferase RsmD n=1 Tax=Idiomarina sp. TaxID=1874361 RepID=UPI0025B828D1|nr:16S rRNA (guanine(966)-N(2))-methyltransferase RsmD [Idiomarina sp.]